MAQSISNESVCIRDSENAVAVTEDYYDVNLLAAGRFVVSCVAVPGLVIAEAVARAEKGASLRGVLFEPLDLGQFEDDIRSSALVGGISGGMVGLAAAVGYWNLALLPLCAIGGAVALPYVYVNGVCSLYVACVGVPMAFRGAAKMVANSRAVKALTSGAPAGRASLKGIVTKPIFRVRKPGLK